MSRYVLLLNLKFISKEPFAIEECKPELTEEEFSTNITPIVQVSKCVINMSP